MSNILQVRVHPIQIISISQQSLIRIIFLFKNLSEMLCDRQHQIMGFSPHVLFLTLKILSYNGKIHLLNFLIHLHRLICAVMALLSLNLTCPPTGT